MPKFKDRVPDIARLKRQRRDASAEFGIRTHRCEDCEKLYAHQCKNQNHRYLCDDCQERKDSQ